MNIQREMTQRVTNGLNDLRQELLGIGVDVHFVVEESFGGLSVSYITATPGSVGGVIEPGQQYIVGDGGPETFEAPADESDTVIIESKSKKAR